MNLPLCGKLSLILIAIFQWRCHNTSCTMWCLNRSKLDTQGNWLAGIQLKDARELFRFESPLFKKQKLSNCISPNKTGTENHDSKSPGWLQLSRIIWRTDVVGDCHINLICWAHGVDDVVNVLSHPFDDPPLERLGVAFCQSVRFLHPTNQSLNCQENITQRCHFGDQNGRSELMWLTWPNLPKKVRKSQR